MFSGCSYGAKRSDGLKSHIRQRKTKFELLKPFACTFKGCDYRAARKGSLDSHVKRRHGPARTKEVPCTLCPLKFYSESKSNAHIQSHLKENAYACKYCTFKTHHSGTLRIHVYGVHKKVSHPHMFRACL